MTGLPSVTVSVLVDASPEQAWNAFTTPEAITRWNFASPDWHCPRAENELREGGSFSYRMEARDQSFGFDFAGRFLTVSPPNELHYSLGPEREVIVQFTREGKQTRVSESFTPEGTHSLEQQRAGWQAILDNYKQYVESTTSAQRE